MGILNLTATTSAMWNIENSSAVPVLVELRGWWANFWDCSIRERVSLFFVLGFSE